ncbi:hypothetical protein ACI3ET_13300 [Ornithinimicrobium sp. LYQ121]|uniref:hypothetical protein n=1 Tax=Ornithinimicrobium sp. LYQ121 TaxID=3378801 RepID=UPI003855539A
MDDRAGWEVFDDTGHSLFYSDRLRAEGFARRRFAREGGTITVIGRMGEQLAQYAVKPWSGQPPRGQVQRRRRR